MCEIVLSFENLNNEAEPMAKHFRFQIFKRMKTDLNLKLLFSTIQCEQRSSENNVQSVLLPCKPIYFKTLFYSGSFGIITQSINQSRFYFFVRYTADNHIKMYTCGRKKGITDKTIYVETCANSGLQII